MKREVCMPRALKGLNLDTEFSCQQFKLYKYLYTYFNENKHVIILLIG